LILLSNVVGGDGILTRVKENGDVTCGQPSNSTWFVQSRLHDFIVCLHALVDHIPPWLR